MQDKKAQHVGIPETKVPWNVGVILADSAEIAGLFFVPLSHGKSQEKNGIDEGCCFVGGICLEVFQ